MLAIGLPRYVSNGGVRVGHGIFSRSSQAGAGTFDLMSFLAFQKLILKPFCALLSLFSYEYSNLTKMNIYCSGASGNRPNCCKTVAAHQ